MTAALEGGWVVSSTPGLHFTPGKDRRLGGPQGWSERTVNLVSTRIRSRTVKPVVSCYTGWATGPTHTHTHTRIYRGWSKSLCAPDPVYSNNPHTIDDLKMAITEHIWNVDCAILNMVFENTVWHVNKCLETGGGHFEHCCNFLYCNHQVYRDFLITLYKYTGLHDTGEWASICRVWDTLALEMNMETIGLMYFQYCAFEEMTICKSFSEKCLLLKMQVMWDVELSQPSLTANVALFILDNRLD